MLKDGKFVAVPQAVYTDLMDALTDRQVRVLMTLYFEAHWDTQIKAGETIPAGSVYTSFDRLSDLSKQSKTTVYRTVALLQEYGVLLQKRNKNGTVLTFTPRYSPAYPCNESGTKTEQKRNAQYIKHKPLNNPPFIPPKGGKKPGKVLKATQIDPKWTPSEDLREWARTDYPLVDVDAEYPQFVDYYLAEGKPQKDWKARFRTWVRNSDKWSKRDGRIAPVKQPPKPRWQVLKEAEMLIYTPTGQVIPTERLEVSMDGGGAVSGFTLQGTDQWLALGDFKLQEEVN